MTFTPTHICSYQYSGRRISIPGKILGYLALCSQVKRNHTYKPCTSSKHLPFVSEITNKYTPNAVIRIDWSYLKY